MNIIDLNFWVREDGCIVCDDPEIVRAYVEQHDQLLAALRGLVDRDLRHFDGMVQLPSFAVAEARAALAKAAP